MHGITAHPPRQQVFGHYYAISSNVLVGDAIIPSSRPHAVVYVSLISFLKESFERLTRLSFDGMGGPQLSVPRRH